MDLSEYQEAVRAIWKENLSTDPRASRGDFTYQALGLVGEAGEVAEKVKKVIRDRGGTIDDTIRDELTKELGDVLWYMAQFASETGISLDDVARGNLEKVRSRFERGVIHGDGDDR